MERDFEEEDKHEKHKLTVVDPDWIDLRETIAMDLVLDHLEVDDYIRFSAVCKKWQSIRKEHRIKYSPYSSRLPLPFPWLRCFRCSLPHVKEVNIVFHLPNKQKTYSIPLPKPYKRHFAFDFSHGRQILLLDQSLCISNPITGVQIKLPPLPDLFSSSHVLPISHPPSDPDCTVIVESYNGKAYLNRINSNSGWKTIQCHELRAGAIIFCHNKIYYLTDCRRVLMINTLLSDMVEQIIEMDCSEISISPGKGFWLVDYFGELVMAKFIFEKSIATGVDTIMEFEIYKADFSRNKWLRMKSLGEYALFLSWHSRFAITAVDVGCKKNTIYYTGNFIMDRVWRAFDLSSKDWIDGSTTSLPCNFNGTCSWFIPSLDYFGVGKENEARQIQSE